MAALEQSRRLGRQLPDCAAHRGRGDSAAFIHASSLAYTHLPHTSYTYPDSRDSDSNNAKALHPAAHCDVLADNHEPTANMDAAADSISTASHLDAETLAHATRRHCGTHQWLASGLGKSDRRGDGTLAQVRRINWTKTKMRPARFQGRALGFMMVSV